MVQAVRGRWLLFSSVGGWEAVYTEKEGITRVYPSSYSDRPYVAHAYVCVQPNAHHVLLPPMNVTQHGGGGGGGCIHGSSNVSVS